MRLLRHISFSNVIAVIALFIALGGAAYAGTKLNGKNIVNASIGGGKLKNETITGDKIKKGTITGTQIQQGSISSSSIDLSTLGTVPSATTASTATKADSATTAGTANSATSAENAKHAETADNAKHAETADSATHAGTADSATTATSATSADNATHADSATSASTATEAGHATTAGEAETLEGKTATDLTVSCQSGTELYGGMCWDETNRAPKLWLAAVKECGEAGGRLPLIGELIAFVLRPGEQVSEQTWSGDLSELEGGLKKEVVFTTDENGRSTAVAGLLGFRCVFPRSN
jgi:hypothetical protein